MQNLLQIVKNLKYKAALSLQQELGLDDKNLSADSKRCLEVLLNHYLEIKDAGDFANRSGISLRKLIYLFKDTAFTPGKLLMALRIRHAIHLMQNPGLTLGEISQIIGCKSEKGFNQIINRVFGLPPTQVRKEILQGQAKKYFAKIIKSIGCRNSNG